MPPKAGGKMSARSSTSRDQASSPPKQSRDRDSESPVGRRTRSTRSQSAEPRKQDTGTKKTKRGRNTSREGSADSVGSNVSAASSRGGRTRQATRAAAVSRGKYSLWEDQKPSIDPFSDLSIVAEDREAEHAEEEEEPESMVHEHSPRVRSPGAVSQISGTTAVTSRSQSQFSQLSQLDTTIAEMLPDLLIRSRDILDILAPSDATEETIEGIVKNLMAPGSQVAKRLVYREKSFSSTRDNFGSDDYIIKSFILRKLLGSDEPGEGIFRPDAILYAANLATLVKTFMVTQKKGSDTFNTLMRLDNWFPEVFVSKFDEDVQFGGSNLLDQSFDMGLDIRTQFVIVDLISKRDLDDFDPDYILASAFYAPPEQPNESMDSFEDITANGRMKDILRGGPPNSKGQAFQIRSRINEIRNSFRQNYQAVEAGDVVDFDQLEESFPWSTFLINLVRWARLRFDEVSQSIAQQGGAEEITRDLIEVMQSFDTQSEVQSQIAKTSKTHQVQSSAPIVPSGSSQSLYNHDTFLQLQQMKKTTGAPSSAPSKDAFAPSSSLPQQRAAPAVPRQEPTIQGSKDNRSPAHEPSDWRPDYDDGDEMAIAVEERATAEYASIWQASSNEKNKENLAVARPTKKRRLLDSQSNAESVPEWSNSEGSPEVPSKRLRLPVEEEESQDEGFEEDERIPNPKRRMNANLPRRPSPAPERPRPSKKARTHHRAASEDAEQSGAASRERAESALRANARRIAFDDELDEEYPAPSASQISIFAREETARRKLMSREPTKKRIPWSEKDTQYLIDCVGEYGCSWSRIFRCEGWDTERDQVALKDKARNLKVNFLKADIPLPPNFENVHLGKKEINTVRTVIPDYEE
ncbi:hypothetical protein EG329_003841 [Mollisiaceae sp. DMI_Dod_QoI]|nr:hypothetical protein EG329_003841 [Helotiales sp. DMI_Dod_QoI]